MANKKVINATPNEVDSIKFKSRSEAVCYKKLKEAGFNPKYEEESYVLFNTHKLTDNLVVYIGNTKTKELEQYTKTLRKAVYTPDFTFDYGNYHIIIEVKGFPNDTYPFKRKIFMTNLSLGNYNIDPPTVFFEVHNSKEVSQAIEIIKSLPMDYIRSFRKLSVEVFKGKDLALSKAFIDARAFKDLYDLVKAECIKEEKNKVSPDAIISPRYKLLLEFEGLLKDYCTILGENLSVDNSEEFLRDDDILSYEEEYS